VTLTDDIHAVYQWTENRTALSYIYHGNVSAFQALVHSGRGAAELHGMEKARVGPKL